VLSSAASAASAEAKSNAKRVFMLRVLKDVELAATGKVEGSAFLPHITRPKTLVVDYTQNHTHSLHSCYKKRNFLRLFSLFPLIG